jgi:protein tyrosine phosphatase (PTP) superfamily phosphohydrolase (DUF442 family)
MSRLALVLACIALSFSLAARAADPPRAPVEGVDAPNVVVVSDTWVTSGQPTAASLAQLARHGYKAVVYLAPPTVPDAVATEPELVRGQGLAFVNIPIAWTAPTAEDFAAFVAAMHRFEGQKVLVHCQANMRASAMTFLYRVIEGKEDPEQAWDTVQKIWTPEGAWRDFVNARLQAAGIAFRAD